VNHPLPKPLRTQLENTVKAARDVAETAARAALAQLAVADAKAPEYLTESQRVLRRKLRAHARALSASSYQSNSIETRHLVWEVAYEHWHRMLFARFLAENGLLLWEPGAPVTLAECDELVQDATTSLGAKSGWELAGKLAARMLPQVFKPHNPVYELVFAPEHQRALEKLLAGLPVDVFTASDSLGWVYQFWQAKRKDEVNASEVKIGADELPAVTQLFTEPYMVDFLLHNSLGAWWATRHPGQPCPVPMTYLRTVPATPPTRHCEEHSDAAIHDSNGLQAPAAGNFEGWPNGLKDFKLLDPCCGSGHFLVAAFLLLVPMRMASEGLSAMDAVDAVLADNLHGLELDARCVEIAVFALALAAWRFPDENGNPLGVRADMPAPNIACCGLKVAASADEWEALVPDSLSNSELLRQEIRGLHGVFSQAPLLGSLLDPVRSLGGGSLGLFNFDALKTLLEHALATETPATQWNAGSEIDDASWDLALTARGLLDAAQLLDGRYHLVITNVPYLARSKQTQVLRDFSSQHYPDAKNDLANVFLERCLELALLHGQGVVQIVMPQNWLFLAGYKKQRENLLKRVRWDLLARLGPGAFDTISGEVVQAVLLTQTYVPPDTKTLLKGLDASALRTAQGKGEYMLTGKLKAVKQLSQLENPDSVVSFDLTPGATSLSNFADCYQGASTVDIVRFRLNYWEPISRDLWNLHMSTPAQGAPYSGHEYVSYTRSEGYAMANLAAAMKEEGLLGGWLSGNKAWGRGGIAISWMGNLPVSIYTGCIYDHSVAVIVPKDETHLAAIWAYCSSDEYNIAVRQVNQKLQVANATLVKVPFDLAHWQQVAVERYPNGLPQPYSDDPTQWLFHGHPQPATDPLQVAVARLVGYRWPAEQQTTPTAPNTSAKGELQTESASIPLETCASSYQIDNIDPPAPAPEKAAMELSDAAHAWIARCTALSEHTDDDGIVCLPPVRGEKPASERLLSLLIAAWETTEPGSWKAGTLDKLLLDAGCAGKGLDVWLRDHFFEQHAKRFQHRPFIWHVWDGLRDGFAALVNYHRLDAKNLERLIHTYLGDWIRNQEAGVANGTDGAPLRLSAALALKKKLEAIQKGESDGKAGYDIFVRWKPLAEQPIGWNPDLNDGVRMNIRPFMTAEVLRHNKKPKLNITWDKDRGKDVASVPWFKVFHGDRINDHHLTLAEKMVARKVKQNES